MNLGEGYRKSWLGVDTHTHTKTSNFWSKNFFFFGFGFFQKVGGRWSVVVTNLPSKAAQNSLFLSYFLVRKSNKNDKKE